MSPDDCEDAGKQRIDTAALWLAANREDVPEPIFPFIREKFGLTILQAIEALKRGHIIRWHGGE